MVNEKKTPKIISENAYYSYFTLSEENVADSCIYVVFDRLSTVDHQTVNKFHRLCPLTSQFTRHHNFAALGITLHDETKNTITSSESKTEISVSNKTQSELIKRSQMRKLHLCLTLSPLNQCDKYEMAVF